MKNCETIYMDQFSVIVISICKKGFHNMLSSHSPENIVQDGTKYGSKHGADLNIIYNCAGVRVQEFVWTRV